MEFPDREVAERIAGGGISPVPSMRCCMSFCPSPMTTGSGNTTMKSSSRKLAIPMKGTRTKTAGQIDSPSRRCFAV